MAASKELVKQTDDDRELSLAAEHHELAPTYNDQDLSEFLFANPTGDFEFVPLEEVAESGKTPSSQIVAASQAPDRKQKPRRTRSLWETMKEALSDIRHGDVLGEHTTDINSAASEQPSVRSEPDKQEESQSPVIGGWPLMDAADEQE